MQLPLESVPNVSEGRDRAVIDELAAAFGAHARLLDVHADGDHNRSVYTLVGSAEELADALLAGAAVARDRIDLRRHEGAHPRVGALDVAPIVALGDGDLPRAREAALAVAARLAAELALPVFLYGDEVGRGRGRDFFRRGGPEELQRRLEAGELAPDFGPARLDPAAGGVLVGARRPLIALNVDLAGATLADAQAIARSVRERDGGFPGVRALGLELPRAGRVQVSMNIEDWRATAPHAVLARIEAEAAARGAAVARSELVGLMPAGAAAAAAGALLRLDGFDGSRLIEPRLLDQD